MPKNDRAAALQELIDGMVEDDPTVPGILLAVESDDFTFVGASGRFKHEGRALRPNDLFRIASVTKTYVSAALFKLAEGDDLSMDDAIGEHLSPESVEALEEGGYDPDNITVRQLLNHTAGIYGYTSAEEYQDSGPERVWTRAEQLQLAMDDGEPLNEPGEEFHYGDTHYILAAEILEQVTGKNMAKGLRETLRIDELGLKDTFWELLEPPSTADAMKRLSHPYYGEEDTRRWHPSWDLFGGGGLISSTADMLRFFKALFDTSGEGIFAHEETLEDFLSIEDAGEGEFFGIDGGYGINLLESDHSGPCYGGYGFFSTILVFCPDEDLYIAATENQSERDEPYALLERTLEIMAR